MAQEAEEKIKNELLKDYFCTVVTDDIMTQDKVGNIYLGGEKITPGEAQDLKKDAEYLKDTRLWRVLTMSLIDQAHKTMFENSTNWNDMISGKMMLYNIGVQKNIIERLVKLEVGKVPHLQESVQKVKSKG